MIKYIAIHLILLASFLFPQERYYNFYDLRGIEDSSDITHLFYRKIGSSSSGYNYSIYKLDLTSTEEKLHITSSSFPPSHIDDYTFWHNNPSLYIALATDCYLECWTHIVRHDTYYYPSWQSNSLATMGLKISISNFNDSLIYASIPYLVKSTDGGKNWSEFEDAGYFAELSPYDSSTYFIYNEEGQLLKTKNGGDSYYLVDSLITFWVWAQRYPIIFDKDNQFIYRKVYQWGTYHLSISNNSGEPFSWSVKYSSQNEIYISVDTSRSGVIYLADGRKIFESTDYGNTFNLFKELDEKISGIYKKPGSNKLYAATKYKILEIEDNSIKIIKRLKLDPEIFTYYPMAVGNK